MVDRIIENDKNNSVFLTVTIISTLALLINYTFINFFLGILIQCLLDHRNVY